MFFLTRNKGDIPIYLYNWDDGQSAWGPDRAKAYPFTNPAAAMDMAVMCSGPPDGNDPQISVVEV